MVQTGIKFFKKTKKTEKINKNKMKKWEKCFEIMKLGANRTNLQNSVGLIVS